MQKLNVIVPLEGAREQVVSYFANNGVTYLVPMENFISHHSVPEDASEETTGEIALLFAQDLASQNGLIVDEIDGIYELISDGTFLGWVAECHPTEWDY